ncbi:tyrosine-protein phosphatase [Aneurinibacillus tyrosinisolvens]|uniref:tyrosine-protein phosphatase n=1 Tax=Aneurinibacillus tyrosinisolvens TaxID=1443435 RepID=UPI00063FC2F3|nr:CpsB/CapC family capsule biosynthesis tyrosine phosphatase [Aneurinibacillus tyrosinisolvens]
MVDIHSHILWGLDDGAQQPEDTLDMARAAVADGITHIVATPHHKDGKYHNPAASIRERVAEANVLLAEHQIPLTVLPGMELHLYGEVIEDFHAAEQTILTLNDAQQFILLELPHDHVPCYTQQLLFDIQVEGYVPIIAHPERNREIREHPNTLYRMIEKGALSQLTAASVAGQFSADLQKISLDLVKHNLVHFIACDAHNITRRGFALQAAYNWVEKNLGVSYVQSYQENARKIVSGHEIYVPEPKRVEKRKKFLGLF